MSWAFNGRFATHNESGLKLELDFVGEVIEVTNVPAGVSTRDLPKLISEAQAAFIQNSKGASVPSAPPGSELDTAVNAGKPQLKLRKKK